MTSRSDEEKPRYNGFKVAGLEILDRLKKPIMHTTFWINLVVGVVGLGGTAIWIEWWHWWHAQPGTASLDNLKLALATVFPAVLGGSALELVLSKTTITKNIGVVVGTLCFIAALYLLGFGHPSDCFAIWMSSICCVLSVVIWWIARGRDEGMQDEQQDALDAVGGSTDRALNEVPTKLKT